MLHRRWVQEAVVVKLKRVGKFGQMWALLTVTVISNFRGDDKTVDDSQNAPPQSPSGTNIFCLLFRPLLGRIQYLFLWQSQIWAGWRCGW